MSAKSVSLWALVGLLVGVSMSRAQDYTPSNGVITADPGPSAGPLDSHLTATPGAPPVPTLSRYILGSAEACCGPMGKHGPIDLELYLRAGLNTPIQGGIFNDTLETGWMIQAGGRSLFFDASDTAAWTIDLSVTNKWNHGQRPDIQIPLRNILVPNPTPQGGITSEVNIPRINVTVRNLNRTFANLGFGREWYLMGTGHGGGPAWRVGFDAGGRWGSANLNTHEIPHRTDVVGGAWAAVHSDVEWTYGGFVFFGGLRFEWDYTWSDILQIQNDSDFQEANYMISGGFRF